ncbi:hypothetical protein [Burkholderia gladioli]|uniref:hypothetical protein n=1 Tax=Burkholderia gladioli TaxID=28095 RepID=UPI001641EE66|nr:hypothetical protein [Burkholderia gladioli]
MLNASARPEQTNTSNSLASLVNCALRAAALSDRPNDAIDTLAAALLTIAAINRAEADRG